MGALDNLTKEIELENPAPAPSGSPEVEKLSIEQINSLINKGLQNSKDEIVTTVKGLIDEALKNITNTPDAPDKETPAPPKEEGNENG